MCLSTRQADIGIEESSYNECNPLHSLFVQPTYRLSAQLVALHERFAVLTKLELSASVLIALLVAVVIVVLFLKKKIQSKLKEVELRQDFHLQQKKSALRDDKSTPPRN